MSSLEGYSPSDHMITAEVYDRMILKAHSSPKRPPLAFVVTQAAEEFHRMALHVEEQKLDKTCQALLPRLRKIRDKAENLLREKQQHGTVARTLTESLRTEFSEIIQEFWQTELLYTKVKTALENILEEKEVAQSEISLYREHRLPTLFISITCQNYILNIQTLFTYL